MGKMEKADGRVRTIFNAFDLNGDGTLQLGELRCFLGDGAEDLCREMDEFKLPPPLAVINSCIGVREWRAFFEQLGADVMEQKLSKLEQVVQSTDIRKKREEYKTKMEKADGRVRTIFNAFDLNGDGTLQLGELRCFLGDGAEDLCREMDEFKLPPPLAVINSCIGVREWRAFFEQLGADVMEQKLSKLEQVVQST